MARLLWAITYGLVFAIILTWMTLSFGREWREIFLVSGLLLCLVSFPLLSHIEHGQVDIFIISLVLASYLCYARKKHLVAAILLAVATLIKVSPGFLLIYYLIFRRDLRFLLMYGAEPGGPGVNIPVVRANRLVLGFCADRASGGRERRCILVE